MPVPVNHGAALHYDCFGYGPRKLLLLHGWAMNSSYWLTLIPFLEKEFCIYSIDLPGHGKNRDLSLNLMEFISNIANDFRCDFYVGGWSLGAHLATRVATLCKDRVLGLISIAFNPCFVTRNEWSGVSRSDFQSLQQALSRDPAKALRRFNMMILGRVFSNRFDASELHDHFNMSKLAQGLSFLASSDLRMYLKLITAPQLHIYGTNDPLISQSCPKEMAKLLPGAKIEMIADGQHVPFLYFPDRIAAKIKAVYCD